MANKDYDENKLLKSCMDGNTTAFEIIVHKYKSLVCAITYSAVGQVEKSEELAQQAFVNAWKNLKQLNDFNKFKAWLLSITRNVIRDFFRKQNRDIVSQAQSIDSLKEVEAKTPKPLNVIISREQQEIIRDSLQHIPEIYREPLVLFYRQQQSIREVAGSLDITEGIARTRLSRGRKMLREHLAEMVESGIGQTAPKKAFTTAVIASVAGMAIKGSGVAAAADIATASSTTGTAASVAAVMSGAAVKVITAAAVILIGVAAVVVYKQINKTDQTSTTLPAAIAGEKEEDAKPINEHHKAIKKATRQATQMPTKAIDLPVADIVDNPPSQTEETKPPAITTAPALVENDEYEFVPKGVLSGLITDIETGEPVIDAEVMLERGRYNRTKTDENGFYNFEKIEDDGIHRVGVYSKEYVGLVEYDKQPQIYLKNDSQLVKHFQLPKACMVDAYVVDEAGIPIPDTRLWVTSLAEERGREVGSSHRSYRTDENGYRLLGGIPAANTQYLIAAVHSKSGKWITEEKRKYREQIREYAPGYSRVTLQDPNIIEYCQIVLKKGDTIRGIAKYTDGTPAKECKIVPTPDWWHSTTVAPQYPIDPNGAFTLSHIADGTYDIQVSIPHDNGGGSTMPAVFTTKLPLEDGKLLEVTVPKKPTEVSSSARTIKKDDPKPKLYGIVTDAVTGEPVNDFRIRYKVIKGYGYSSAGKWSQFSNTKGQFKLDVPGGKHVICKVQAVTDGYASQWSEQIDTANNSPVSIELTSGGSITGTVVDGRGNAVANAKILPFSLAGSVKSSSALIFASEEGAVSTDKKGLFALNHLASGTEHLKVIHPEYTYLISSAIPVDQGQINDIGNLVLENGGTVEGFVYDNQGTPQPNITLYAKNHYMFSSSKLEYAAATTDPNGFYRMEHLPGELCYITQGNAYQKTGVVTQGIVPANNKTTRFDFGGGPVVKGRIIINGKPLAQTRVNLTMGYPVVSGLYRCQTNTDESGSFTLRASIPATYTMSYDKRTKVSTSQNFKLLDVHVAQKDIDLGVILAKGKTLRVQVEISDQTEEEPIRWFFLRENDPLYGGCIYWNDQPALSDMPLQINNLRPGLYYACASLHGGGEYSLPIEITEENDNYDITFPIQVGHVTLTGNFPAGISHALLTNEEQTFNCYIFLKETGKYTVDGLMPGTYFVSPKRHNFNDSIVITVPDINEYTFDFSLEQLQEKLTDDLFVYVMDKNGYPVENADIWIDCNGKILSPVWHDGYSGRFYLPTGKHIIYAEKDGLKAQKLYEFNVDKKNTANMESRETFIQFQQENKE